MTWTNETPYHVRNPNRNAPPRQLLAEKLQWTMMVNGGTKRISNSKDTKEGRIDNETVTIVQKDESPFMSLRAKNDPVVTYSEHAPNYPIKYSCEHTVLYSAEGEAYEAIEPDVIVLNDSTVQLGLQVQVPTSILHESIDSNIEALQWSILNDVAKQTGLSKGCNISIQNSKKANLSSLTSMNEMHAATNPNADATPKSAQKLTNHVESNVNPVSNEGGKKKHRRANALLSSLPYPVAVYSVATTPSKWTVQCPREVASFQESTDACITAQIKLDVKYRGNTEESILVKHFMQSLVHNQLALDPMQLFAEDITGLKWLSEDDVDVIFDSVTEKQTKKPINFFPEDNTSMNDSEAIIPAENTEEPSSHLFVSIVIPLATACILVVIWFITHVQCSKKRRRENALKHTNHRKLMVMTNHKEFSDIENGSTKTERSESPTLNGSSPSRVQCDKIKAKSPRRRRSTPISVDSPERSAAGLPPRPMVVKRDVSLHLKKKRKKKKRGKKKVLALTRVSSRENIAELPMISESESECDSDSGDDEFSHSDDRSWYDASTGCLTPTRRSHGNSRTSSSSHGSPHEDPFLLEPNDATNYEFIMEAPEFSEELSSAAKLTQEVVSSRNLNQNLVQKKPRLEKRRLTVSCDEIPQITPEIVAQTGRSMEHSGSNIKSSSDTSFREENVSETDRMMPLPWLISSRNHY